MREEEQGGSSHAPAQREEAEKRENRRKIAAAKIAAANAPTQGEAVPWRKRPMQHAEKQHPPQHKQASSQSVSAGSPVHYRDDSPASYVPASELGPQHGGSCTPTCTWKCDKPTCDQVCEPVCSAPKCETRCAGISTDGCSMECERPHCSIMCPKSVCGSGNCLPCHTKCSEPQCKLQCPKSQNCKNVCEQPQCKWNCKAPLDCPKPKCKMTCEPPPKCHTTSFMDQLPPLLANQMAVPSFPAPLPTTSMAMSSEAEDWVSPTSVVDVHVRSLALDEAPERTRRRVISMPVLPKTARPAEGPFF